MDKISKILLFGLVMILIAGIASAWEVVLLTPSNTTYVNNATYPDANNPHNISFTFMTVGVDAPTNIFCNLTDDTSGALEVTDYSVITSNGTLSNIYFTGTYSDGMYLWDINISLTRNAAKDAVFA